MFGYAVFAAAFVNFAETQINMQPKRNISITILLIVIIGCVYWNDLVKFMSSGQNINFSDSNFARRIPSKSNSSNKVVPKTVDLKNDKEQNLQKWLNQMEKKYSKIKKRIKRVCERYHIQKRDRIRKHSFIVDHKYRMALCLHPKAGTTTWKQYFFELLPNKRKNSLAKSYDFKFGKWNWGYEKYWQFLNNLTSSNNNSVMIALNKVNKYLHDDKILMFSFVRHPFERLVSAYNDRILDLNNDKHNFVVKYGLKKWYDKDHSFPAFVDLVLKQYRGNCSPSMYQAKSYQSQCEFNVNLHWRPFASKCSYCDVEYDLVGKIETFDEDLKYIVHKKGLEKILRLENSGMNHHSTKGSTEKMTEHYFSKLTKKQGYDLYNMYHLDFEMFDYDPKPYLDKN